MYVFYIPKHVGGDDHSPLDWQTVVEFPDSM